MSNYDLQTDTHLSKDYNKVLQNCMMTCNNAQFSVESQPHYELLLSYFAAVNTFFNNTYFLFEHLKFQGRNYTEVLMEKMWEVRKMVNLMKLHKKYQTQKYFYSVLEQCSQIHMMIMGGLQQRKMLVRMSETEPKGARSIEYWENKRIFGNSEMKIKKNGKNQKYI